MITKAMLDNMTNYEKATKIKRLQKDIALLDKLIARDSGMSDYWKGEQKELKADLRKLDGTTVYYDYKEEI